MIFTCCYYLVAFWKVTTLEQQQPIRKNVNNVVPLLLSGLSDDLQQSGTGNVGERNPVASVREDHDRKGTAGCRISGKQTIRICDSSYL